MCEFRGQLNLEAADAHYHSPLRAKGASSLLSQKLDWSTKSKNRAVAREEGVVGTFWKIQSLCVLSLLHDMLFKHF